jgi:hypothetical protein
MPRGTSSDRFDFLSKLREKKLILFLPIASGSLKFGLAVLGLMNVLEPLQPQASHSALA